MLVSVPAPSWTVSPMQLKYEPPPTSARVTLTKMLIGPLKSVAEHAGEPVWKSWGQDVNSSLTSRQQRLDYDLYLPDDILVKMDRASMAHSIEVRSPLLDYRVAEWAAALPRSALLDSQQGKIPLRNLSRRLLPTEVDFITCNDTD